MTCGIIEGSSDQWEMVIGLEVHAQVSSKSKLFSGASADFNSDPNTQVALLDVAMPGVLPVVNFYCVEQAVRTALALSCDINTCSIFDRKNYFYPDLALGYQITQFYHPIARNGCILLDNIGPGKEIRISSIHLEQDAGKSMHMGEKTYLDFNRAGVALMEIISEPDLRSAEEAAEYLRKLRMILRYVGTCDGDMENGSLRCDANVSVRRVGESALGVRSEIKNLNSIKYMSQAIEYEARKQVEILENGGKVRQTTLLYDVDSGSTKTMREKEDVCDYRYFPDPDLRPIEITQEFISSIRDTLPELPDAKLNRYVKDLGMSTYNASVLSSDRHIAEYFERVLGVSKFPVDLVVSWVTVELFGALNKRGLDIRSSPVSSEDLGGLLKLIVEGTISAKIAKQVFATMFETGESAFKIVSDCGLQQVLDEGVLKDIVHKVLSSNREKVLEYKQGKEKLFGYFVGQVMKETQGKANPEIVNRLISEGIAGTS